MKHSSPSFVQLAFISATLPESSMGRMYKMEQTERSSRGCPLRGSNDIHVPSKHDFSLFYPTKQGREEFLTPAVERDLKYSFQARLFPLQGWGLIDLPLRASTRGVCDRALREHRRTSGSIPLSVPRAGGRPGRATESPLRLCLLRTRRNFHRSHPARPPSTRLFESVCRDAEGLDG